MEETARKTKDRESEDLSLPIIEFQGRIYFRNDFEGCAMICDEIIQRIENKCTEEIVPIGFDLEWPLYSVKGNKSALAQLCVSTRTCHLFHIYNIDKLPAALVQLLSHPKVKLVGVNVTQDIRKLGRDFSGFPAQKVVENNCIECGALTNKRFNSTGRWSLAKLTVHLLKKRLEKPDCVRKSAWHKTPLSEAQKIYAATDAYARETRVLWAGRLEYGSALRLQRALADNHAKRQGRIVNSMILVEHEPVYTVGIRDKIYDKHSEMKLRNLGAGYYRTNRGGLITYHGPGQLVVYPIIDLRLFDTSVRRYVGQIEEIIIRLCAEFGIKAGKSSDTGVWVDNRKICAIGIHASRYITTHGLALNCNTDLKWFDHIVPCGIEGKGVTSISQQLGVQVTIADVIPLFKNAFKDQFQCSLVNFPLDEAANLLRSSNEITKVNTCR